MEKKEVVQKCCIENCKRPYRAKGYCNIHYKKWRQGELPHRRYKTCSAPECRKPITQKALCAEHYKAKFGKAEEAAAPVTEAPAAPAENAPPAS